MNQYVFNKMYNTDFSNLVPLALANILHVNIGIISKDVRDYNARVIHANASNDTLGNILIYKTPDHYDSIILKPVDTGYNSQVYCRYKQTGVSPTGRHHGPVSHVCVKTTDFLTVQYYPTRQVPLVTILWRLTMRYRLIGQLRSKDMTGLALAMNR